MTVVVKLFHCFIVILSLIIFLADDAFALLKINEIYPAPSSGEYEWIEIYNDGTKDVDLTSYFLTDEANKTIKFQSSSINPQSFAIATSSSILNNDGDTVYLKKNQEEIIDFVKYTEKLSANDSFAKCPDGSDSWFIVNNISKNFSNVPACQRLSPTASPQITDDSLPTPIPTPQSYDSIFLTEVMVAPENGNNEWIEIFNDNGFQVILTDWYIDDLENAGSTPKKFSLTIAAKSYGIYELTSSIFNNDGDSVMLLSSKQEIKDSFQYQNPEKGKSIGKFDFSKDAVCIQNTSKGLPNNPCLGLNSISPNKTSVPSLSAAAPTPTPSPKATKKTPTPVKFWLINQNQQYISELSEEIPGDILGVDYQKQTKQNHRYSPLVSSFTFISFSYSILAIISLLNKMKINQ